MEINTDISLTEFKEMVLTKFAPFYTDVDEEHGFKHIKYVCELALKINKSLELGLSEFDIVLASYAHDAFSFTHRKEHHTKAGEYVQNDNDEIYKYLNSKEDVVNAIKEHRASYKGEFSSLLSEVISSADRGIPRTSSIIKRVWKCSLDTRLVFQTDIYNIVDELMPDGLMLSDKLNILREKGCSDATLYTYLHVKEKYAIDGYAKYPDVYKKYFKDTLVSYWDEIDKLLTYPDKFISFLENFNHESDKIKNIHIGDK